MTQTGKSFAVVFVVTCCTGCARLSIHQHEPTKPGHQAELSLPHDPDPSIVTPLASTDWLRIRKADRRLYRFRGSKIVEQFPISLGFSPVGAKDHRDEYKTPEGVYYLCQRNPKSHYYRALRISYPNVQDGERCAAEGLIGESELSAIRHAIAHHATPPQNTRAGGDILIHGGGTGRDWTWGCIALDNMNMKKLYGTLRMGTPVLIEK